MSNKKQTDGRAKQGKYHEWLEKDGLTKIEGWARAGLTDEQIAKNIGIAARTLYVWKDKYPQILQALKTGKEVVDFEVENKLLKRAFGYEYEEVKSTVEKDANGKERIKKERTTKVVPPDVTAIIFWLKNRKPEEWRSKPTAQDVREQEARTKKLEAETANLKNEEAEKPIEVRLISRGGEDGSTTD